MTAQDHIKVMIGDLAVQVAALLEAKEALSLQVQDLEKENSDLRAELEKSTVHSA